MTQEVAAAGHSVAEDEVQLSDHKIHHLNTDETVNRISNICTDGYNWGEWAVP